jgi:hypothetical protein
LIAMYGLVRVNSKVKENAISQFSMTIQ